MVAIWSFGACASTTAPRAEDAIDSYVDAVRGADWRAAYRALDPAVHGGASIEEFVAYCEAHREALQQQAEALALARAAGSAETVADVPVDRVRSAQVVLESGQWRLRDHAPLLEGGSTPTEALASLALLVRSEALDDLLGALSTDLRRRYTAELELVAEALERGAAADLAVYGDSASVTVGEVVVHMRREDGVWRVSGLDQPYVYNGYYDYYY